MENLQIRINYQFWIKDLYVLKNIGICKNLRHFFYGHANHVEEYLNFPYENMEKNVEISENEKFFKIVADADDKTVKISSYIVRCHKNILKILLEFFKGYKFLEFCFEKMNIKEIDLDSVLRS